MTTDRTRAPAIDIRVDDLRGNAIIELLQLHLRSVALHSPPESIHALDLERLRLVVKRPDGSLQLRFEEMECLIRRQPGGATPAGQG